MSRSQGLGATTPFPPAGATPPTQVPGKKSVATGGFDAGRMPPAMPNSKQPSAPASSGPKMPLRPSSGSNPAQQLRVAEAAAASPPVSREESVVLSNGDIRHRDGKWTSHSEQYFLDNGTMRGYEKPEAKK
jgi:hypothetical protein